VLVELALRWPSHSQQFVTSTSVSASALSAQAASGPERSSSLISNMGGRCAGITYVVAHPSHGNLAVMLLARRPEPDLSLRYFAR